MLGNLTKFAVLKHEIGCAQVGATVGFSRICIRAINDEQTTGSAGLSGLIKLTTSYKTAQAHFPGQSFEWGKDRSWPFERSTIPPSRQSVPQPQVTTR